MRFITDRILDLSAVTLDTSSEVLDLDTILNMSIQVTWTSTTASATVKLQVSNDGVNWVDSGESVTINNNSGSAMMKIIDCAFKKGRVLVDMSSGTITSIDAWYQGKGF